MSNQTLQNEENNKGQKNEKALGSALRTIWLPLHHSIRNLSFDYKVDSGYLREFAQRLGLRSTLVSSAVS